MKWRCGGTYMLVYTCRVCIEKKTRTQTRTQTQSSNSKLKIEPELKIEIEPVLVPKIKSELEPTKLKPSIESKFEPKLEPLRIQIQTQTHLNLFKVMLFKYHLKFFHIDSILLLLHRKSQQGKR